MTSDNSLQRLHKHKKHTNIKFVTGIGLECCAMWIVVMQPNSTVDWLKAGSGSKKKCDDRN